MSASARDLQKQVGDAAVRVKRGSTTIIFALRCRLASTRPFETARMVLGRICPP